ncbi:hypothetical protein KFU94_33295, partial [Chloroflexi bacterium TSY]|nr:hypothetical protein [Chloroflexi bacterium TSY]
WYGRSLLEEVFGEQTVEEQWSQIQLKPLATWLRTIYSWLYEADRFMKLGVALGFMGNTLEELKTLLLEKGAYEAFQVRSPDRNEANRMMRNFITQFSTDLAIIQQAFWQRQRNPRSNPRGASGELTGPAYGLIVGDLLATSALRGAVTANEIPDDLYVVTYFQEKISIRLTPYADICFIGLPFATTPSAEGGPSTDYLAIPHEIGHFIYAHNNFAIRYQIVEILAEKSINIHLDWRARWLEELFADIYGCLIAGPIQVLGFQELLSDNAPIHSQAYEGEHAIDELRPLIQSNVLRKIRYQKGMGAPVYPKAPDVLDAHWRSVVGKNVLHKRYVLPDSDGYLNSMTGQSILDKIDPVIDAILQVLNPRLLDFTFW